MTKIKTGPSTLDVVGEDVAERLTMAVASTQPYLTTRASETHGGRGTWHDLTDAEFEAAPEGLLKTPTADQLALRRT